MSSRSLKKYKKKLNALQVLWLLRLKQGQKRPLDTPKRMIKRRKREKERYREGGRDKRERGRERRIER